MKPILFNTEMVRAIMEGRKTVTRRVVKEPWYIEDEEVSRVSGFAMHRGVECTHRAPYPDSIFRIGQILYVRETWEINNITPHYQEWNYKADYDCNMKPYCDWKWRPSIHMPKEAARLFLRVKDVRVERLQDITVGDVLCEGTPDEEPPGVCREDVPFPEGFHLWSKARRAEWHNSTARARYIGWCDYADKLLRKFRDIWDSTIKPADLPAYGWEANPWVWVIEFEKISKEKAMEGEK